MPPKSSEDILKDLTMNWGSAYLFAIVGTTWTATPLDGRPVISAGGHVILQDRVRRDYMARFSALGERMST
jgi:hypothetical protein